MSSLKKWILGVVVLLFCVCAVQTLALMPPKVYHEKIKKSLVKVTAKVISIEIAGNSKHAVFKKVKFQLIKSYGKITPPKIFIGHCLSAGKKPICGGDIYYNPEKNDVVFVTLAGGGKNTSNDCGDFTSYTKLTEKLKSTLNKKGLLALSYGIGSVYIKKENGTKL